MVFTVIVEDGSPAKGGDGMKMQAWERLEILCGFFMPEVVLSGGGGCLLVVGSYQQMHQDVYGPSC